MTGVSEPAKRPPWVDGYRSWLGWRSYIEGASEYILRLEAVIERAEDIADAGRCLCGAWPQVGNCYRCNILRDLREVLDEVPDGG